MNGLQENDEVSLDRAAHDGKLETVRALIEAGADVNLFFQSLTALHLAVRHNHPEIVKLLLENKANIDAREDNGPTPLHTAVSEGRQEIACALIQAGADVNLFYQSLTALHLAVRHNHPEIVKLLLENKANIDACEDYGPTPLHTAILEDRQEIGCALIQAGADVNLFFHVYSVLYLAICHKHPEIVKLLVENKANIDALDHAGITPLHTAILVGAQEIASILIQAGADVNLILCDLQTALHIAIKQNHPEIVNLLLKNKANVNACVGKGLTPLQIAVQDGRLGIAITLIQAGADVNLSCEFETALHIAVRHHRPEIVKLLLENKANIDACDGNGLTPLYAAVLMGSQEIASALIEAGADVNLFCQSYTALHIAISGNHPEIVNRLLENKANINAREDDGPTPLYIAVLRGIQEIASMLIQAGADVNLFCQSFTALHIAVSENLPEIVNLLLEKKADPDARDLNGRTPLHTAVLEGRQEIASAVIQAGSDSGYCKLVEILIEYGANINAQTFSKQTALHLAVESIRRETVEFLLNNGIDINLEDEKGHTALDLSVCEELRNSPPDPQIVICLMKFIIKSKVAGLKISENVLRSFNNHKHTNEDELNRFHHDCEEELERLKSEKISPHLALFDVLVDRQNRAYGRNLQLMETLESVKFEKFPIYESLIAYNIKNIKKGKKRFELLASGVKSLTILLKLRNTFSVKELPIVPDEILEKIVSFLNNEELKNFNVFCDQAEKYEHRK